MHRVFQPYLMHMCIILTQRAVPGPSPMALAHATLSWEERCCCSRLSSQMSCRLRAAQPVAAGGKGGGGPANGRRHGDLEAMPVIGTPGSGVQQATARVSTEDSQGVQRRRRSARGGVRVRAAGRMAGRTWLKHLILRPLQAPAARKEDVTPSAGAGFERAERALPRLRLCTLEAERMCACSMHIVFS